jgi:mRNA interferase MazF
VAGETFPREFPRRGEFYDVDFNPARGSEQAGKRPAVIVSNDTINQHSSVVVVAAVTSKTVMERVKYPSAVYVPAGMLREESAILCNQLLTISKERLVEYRGEVDQPRRVNLNRALALVLQLPRP